MWASTPNDGRMTTIMKRRRHTPEQAVRKVCEGESPVERRPRRHRGGAATEVSEASWDRWRYQYGGMKADEARRLRDLQRENVRLKKLVANKELEIDMLKELAEGNF